MLLTLTAIKRIPVKNKFIRFVHNYIFSMDKAYLRHLNEDSFELTFKYSNETLKVNRQFNFSRKLSESIDTFLTRLSTNVEKVIEKKNKKKKDDDHSYKLSVALYVGNAEIDRSTCCKEVFQEGKKVLLKIQEKEYEVVINSPWIYSLALPTSMMAGFPVYPSKYDAVYTDKGNSQFLWSKSKDKQKWIQVSEGYIFTPSCEDIQHYLKLSCVPKNERLEGPVAEAVSSSMVGASPGECPFEKRHQFTTERTKGREFRVVSYNILADLYCDSDYTREVLFPYCPPYALTIDYRKQLILKEIIGYNADIIALQEVDRKVFKYDLEPTLNSLGYEGILITKGEDVAEGIACFVYKDRLKLISSEKLVFAEHLPKNPLFANIWSKVMENSQLMTRILDRSTTMQINVIESVEHNEMLVLGNVHLYFHPDADHIRLLHGGMAIIYLEDFIRTLRLQNPEKRISLIFCGDFNSVPECGIYKLYTTGKVPKDFIDYESNKEEAVRGVELGHSLKLDSACGTPKYTNYTKEFADCLDYIYYDKENLQVTAVVPLPSDEELTQNVALPSVVFPSDHIALVSDFKWS